MSRSRQINDYVIEIDSNGRQNIDNTEPNDYTVSWPKIAPGKYKVALSILEKSATEDITGVMLRSPCIINHLSTFQRQARAIVMTFDKFRSEGVMYVQDPEGELDVKMINMNTYGPSDVDEHLILMHLTKIGSPD
jgi:hypothetical protein